ncbi:unnamed protein product [Rotaria sp. Silwood2]|nr:unnamed protein product [Rotaria sp. Silwood2]
MKYLITVLVLCLIGYVNSSLSVQEVIDTMLSNIKNKVEVIENNPALFGRIYRYFQEKYPRQDSNRMIDFNNSKRMEIFTSNLKYVIRHNEDPAATFKLKINEFSDWIDEKRDGLRSKLNIDPINNKQPAKSHQHHCGSCYAFGMVGALEKTYAEIYKESGPLSPQQLIDCSGQGGCDGVGFLGSFYYIQRNHDRLHLEKDYPSTPDGKANNKCQNSTGVRLSYNSTYTLKYEQMPFGNEEYMKKIVYERDPVYISFNCGERTGNDTILREVSNKFDHYAAGIFDVPGCPARRNLNHAPVAVGYGTENGTDYWKVKNSWGADRGDHGYIKIKRNENMCGIATSTYYVGLC